MVYRNHNVLHEAQPEPPKQVSRHPAHPAPLHPELLPIAASFKAVTTSSFEEGRQPAATQTPGDLESAGYVDREPSSSR